MITNILGWPQPSPEYLPGTRAFRRRHAMRGKDKPTEWRGEMNHPWKRGEVASTCGYYEDEGLTRGDLTYFGGRIEELRDGRQTFAQWASHEPFYEESEQFKALLLRLSHGRYLVATSPGVGWYVVFDPHIYTDEEDAKQAAWALAQKTAERDLEDKLQFQEHQQLTERYSVQVSGIETTVKHDCGAAIPETHEDGTYYTFEDSCPNCGLQYTRKEEDNNA